MILSELGVCSYTLLNSTSVIGYITIIRSVCSHRVHTVCNFFMWHWIGKILRTIVHIFQGQGHRTHIKNTCQDHSFLLVSWIWMILHTIIVDNLRVCHDFDILTQCHFFEVKITVYTSPFTKCMGLRRSILTYPGFSQGCWWLQFT